MPDLRERILLHVNGPNYQPVKPAVIAKKLGLTGDEAQEVKKFIKRLVKEKQIAYGPSHLVFAAGKSPAQKAAAKKAADKAAAKAAFQAALTKSTGDDEVFVSPIHTRNSNRKRTYQKTEGRARSPAGKRQTHPPAEPRHRHLSPSGGRLRLRPAGGDRAGRRPRRRRVHPHGPDAATRRAATSFP